MYILMVPICISTRNNWNTQDLISQGSGDNISLSGCGRRGYRRCCGRWCRTFGSWYDIRKYLFCEWYRYALVCVITESQTIWSARAAETTSVSADVGDGVAGGAVGSTGWGVQRSVGIYNVIYTQHFRNCSRIRSKTLYILNIRRKFSKISKNVIYTQRYIYPLTSVLDRIQLISSTSPV